MLYEDGVIVRMYKVCGERCAGVVSLPIQRDKGVRFYGLMDLKKCFLLIDDKGKVPTMILL
jgi:hypothetical protein